MGQSPVAKIYARLDAIARELKTALGAGGTVKNGVIEIQGDKVEQIKAWFKSRTAPP
jgi:translation initiation factor 1